MENDKKNTKKTSQAKKENSTTKVKKNTTNKNNQKGTGSNQTKKKQTKTANLKKEIKEPVIEVEEEQNIDDLEEVEDEKDNVTNKEVSTSNSKKHKLKLSDIILIIVLIIVVVLGAVTMKGAKEEVNYTLPLTLTGEAGLQELTYSEYQEKMDNKESFVLIIESATCTHCQNFMPVAEEFAKDNSLPMYYVDTDTFTEDEWSTFYTSNTFMKKHSRWGTPTTIVLAGNEAVDYIEGETTSDKLLELYNDYFQMSE